MKRILGHATLLLAVLVGLFLLAVGGMLTKYTVWQVNILSDLPIDFLAYDRDVDKTSCSAEPMFGGTAYTRGTGNDMLEFNISPWPDLSDKDMRVNYISCTDKAYSVYGVSPGDSAAKGILTLAAFRFIPTEIGSGEARFEKWGISVTLDWDPDSYRIYSIRIHARAANENGILF